MSETAESLNTQLANAVGALASANDRLARTRSVLDDARREECAAHNEVNSAQKRFDELVALVRKSAPINTDWRRPPGQPER